MYQKPVSSVKQDTVHRATTGAMSLECQKILSSCKTKTKKERKKSFFPSGEKCLKVPSPVEPFSFLASEFSRMLSF